MEISGKVIVIGNTETVGQNGFTKRMLVVETAEQYPQKIAIDFVKDKTSVLDNYKVNDSVNVSVNVRGSEYNGRYFVNLQGWKIEKLDAQPIDGGSDIKSFEVVDADIISADDLPW